MAKNTNTTETTTPAVEATTKAKRKATKASPKVAKKLAKTDLKAFQVEAKATTTGRNRLMVCGVSASAALKWFGSAGYTSKAVYVLFTTVLNLPISKQTVNCQVSSGSIGDTGHHGKLPVYTKEQVASLKKLAEMIPSA